MTDLNRTLEELGETAMRVKEQRDRAVALLREVIRLRELGAEGPFKTKVRALLADIEAHSR